MSHLDNPRVREHGCALIKAIMSADDEEIQGALRAVYGRDLVDLSRLLREAADLVWLERSTRMAAKSTGGGSLD